MYNPIRHQTKSFVLMEKHIACTYCVFKQLKRLNDYISTKHCISIDFLHNTHHIRSFRVCNPSSPFSLCVYPLPVSPSFPCPGAVWACRTPSQRWATQPSRSVLPPCPPQLLTSRASACLTWWWGCSTTPRTPSPGWERVSEAHAVTPCHPNTKPQPCFPNLAKYFVSFVNRLVVVVVFFFAVLQSSKKPFQILAHLNFKLGYFNLKHLCKTFV